MKKYLLPLVIAASMPLLSINHLNAQIGTWTKLTNLSPHENMGVMLLLTNGNIICHDTVGGTVGQGWDMLTPDASGSYINGTWTTIASMKYDRFAFSSQVLPNGNVWVAGGEYGAGDTASEVYNPFTNVWTSVYGIPTTGADVAWNIYDAPSELLYNGNVIDGPEKGTNGGSQPCKSILIWSESTQRFIEESNEPLDHDEAQWLKLPDSSVLMVGMPYPNYPATDSSCRYIPQTNTWLIDAMTTDNIYDEYGFESGCGMMLPNGKAIFFGAAQYNDIYTPSGHATPGTWSSAANFPTIEGTPVGQPDAPGAMMVNGHILLACSPIGTSPFREFNSPTYFVEYDYTSNTFTQVTSPLPEFGGDSMPNIVSQQLTFLDLPDGNVLVALDQASSYSTSYLIYTPGSGPIPQGKPTINSILPDECPSYKLTGKLFNGISEGSSFGDDLQNSTNYPIIRLTNGTNVYYCTTTNWNRIGAVQTDSLEDTVVFTVPNIPSGTYSLVVVANGFASNPTLFSVLGISSVIATDITCGSTAGSAVVTGSGGLSPYTYSWSPAGGSGSTGTGLSAGTYTITLRDNDNCSSTASVTITQTGGSINVSADVTAEATCTSGGRDSAEVSGGTSPYTYMWSDAGSQSTITATGLSAGTYTLTVTDNTGCSGTASSTITQAASGIIVTTTVKANAHCSLEGIDSVSASGGISPYTYMWSDAATQTTITATGLSAGTYTITVTDGRGCSATAASTITQTPSSIVVNTTVTASAHCLLGGSDSASASGGVGAYTYMWSDASSQTTSKANGLSAGTYTVTVTDSIGCTGTASTTITQTGSSLIVTATVTANANCAIGGTDSVSVSGGISPYTYLWSGASSQTTINATGLSAGVYSVMVTDSAGCTGTASNTITQPIVLNLSTTATNVSCHGGNNGTDSVSVSGGVSPYTYLWNDANSQSTVTATGLIAGTYNVLVTDSNGCYGTISNIIAQPIVLTGSASVTTNVNCNGAGTGVATASLSGGTQSYTYLWNDAGSQATAVASGLVAGTYTVTMSDSCGASVTASVTITQPAPLSVSALGSGSICSGNSGSASSSASGGTQPYTYLWNDGSSQTTANASGLSTGTYTVTVRDNCGASVTASATVIQVASIGVSASSTSSGCNTNNGTATASASGGTSPYTYSWSGGGGTNTIASGLSGGTYTITVSDSCGNQATASVSIAQSIVSITIASRVIEVCSRFGYITAHAAGGGNPPYTYNWTPSGGTNLATTSNLSAGTYTITATDNNGCSGTASEIITLPPVLTIAASVNTNITCFGGNNGSVSSTVSGGNTPYTYQWLPGGGTNPDEGGLSAGIYLITVTDSNGCAVTAEVIINQPAGMVITQDSVNQTGICNGQASVTVSGGGAAPYTYLWTTGGQTTSSISGQCAGDYCCTITDNNGCSQTTCVDIRNATGINDIAAGSGGISVYPNPNTGVFTMELSVGSGQSTVEIYNILGEKIMNEQLTKASNQIDLSSQPSGIYLYRVIKTENGNLVGEGKVVIQK
jgi:hypothetical protein